MSLETAEILANSLKDIGYSNQIHFGGQSEPLLTKEFDSIIRILKSSIPHNKNFHLTTNGDRLDCDRIDSLVDSGINHINVSCYDGQQQADNFRRLLDGKIPYTIKEFWLGANDNWGLPAVSNRAGKLIPIQKQLNKRCHLPFYAMSVDWNGDVYLCVHDWTKRKPIGNIRHMSVRNIWVCEELNQYREMLMEERRDCAPCNGCDVGGDFYGHRNFNLFKSKFMPT